MKHLTRHGNNLALVIDRGLLSLLNIDAKTPLSVTTDGHRLIVTPVRTAERQKRLRKALETVNRRYGKALKQLAD